MTAKFEPPQSILTQEGAGRMHGGRQNAENPLKNATVCWLQIFLSSLPAPPTTDPTQTYRALSFHTHLQEQQPSQQIQVLTCCRVHVLICPHSKGEIHPKSKVQGPVPVFTVLADSSLDALKHGRKWVAFISTS